MGTAVIRHFAFRSRFQGAGCRSGNRTAIVSGRGTRLIQFGHRAGRGTGTISKHSATAQPTFAHEGTLNFTWGFHPDFDLSILVPIVTDHFRATDTPAVGGTGVSDAMALVKYRFYRRDSERGTTQASITGGLKFPTGRTNLRSSDGTLLPATLQPGSGSTDFFIAANWTYTGLFNLKRLVADEDFHSLLRTQGTQRTRLGSNVESRFWLSIDRMSPRMLPVNGSSAQR